MIFIEIVEILVQYSFPVEQAIVVPKMGGTHIHHNQIMNQVSRAIRALDPKGGFVWILHIIWASLIMNHI